MHGNNGTNDKKGPPRPVLPGKHQTGVAYIRGDGPDGPGLYEVKWGIHLDVNGFVDISHASRRLNTEAGVTGGA